MYRIDGRLGGAVALGALMTLSACGIGIAAGADYAQGLDVTGYASFTWDEPDARPVGDPRLENNPFFEQRLHGAIAVQLADRGITSDGRGRALVVHHHATVRDRVEVYAVDERAGYRPPEADQGTQVVHYDEGTIMVDIADAETRTILWRGWAQFDIGRALTDPEVMGEAVDRAVAAMFEEFPGR